MKLVSTLFIRLCPVLIGPLLALTGCQTAPSSATDPSSPETLAGASIDNLYKGGWRRWDLGHPGNSQSADLATVAPADLAQPAALPDLGTPPVAPDLAQPVASPDLATNIAPPDLATARAPADLAMAPPPADLATAPPPADLATAPPPPDLAQPVTPPQNPDMATAPSAAVYTVESVGPAGGPAGTLLVVTGSGFQSGDAVTISGQNLAPVALATVSLTAGAIIATVPNLGVTPPAKVSVQVRRAGSSQPGAGIPWNYTAGKVHYIATTGSDSNAGTITAPWATINGAARQMSPGDITYVRGGNYTGPYQIEVSGTATAPIIFAGYPGESALLTNPATGVWTDTLTVYGAYVIVDRLRVTDLYDHGAGIAIGKPAHDVVIENCEVFGTKGVGIYTNADYNTFYRNSVHDNGVFDQRNHGIYLDGGWNVVRSNIIYNNQAYGVHVYNGYAGDIRGNNVIEYNYIYHNGYGATSAGYTWNAGIILADNQPNNIVRYNRICDNAQFGVYLTSKQTGNQIQNNAFCYNGSIGINLESPGSGTVVDGNISYYDGVTAFTTQSGVTSDHNDFWNASGAPSFQYNGSRYTFSGYRSASGQDANSTVSNPGFTNVPTTGFSMAAAATYNFCSKVLPALCNPVP